MSVLQSYEQYYCYVSILKASKAPFVQARNRGVVLVNVRRRCMTFLMSLRFSEFEYDFACSTGMKHQALNAVFSQTTVGTNRASPDEEIPILMITTNLFIVEDAEQEQEIRENNEQPA